MMSEPLPTSSIRDLPTPELALELLRALGKDGRDCNPGSVLRGAEAAFRTNDEPDREFLLGRLSDAWAWLESHNLLGNSINEPKSIWMRVTQEGRVAMESQNPLPTLWAAELLAGDLHPAIAAKVRPIFNLGDYETAAFAAMKQVEVAVRNLAKFADSEIGVKMMRAAFKPDGGPLADSSADGGEQVALMELFAGAIGSFKNPPSHRTFHFADPIEAAEVVQLADLLMRLLDRIRKRLE